MWQPLHIGLVSAVSVHDTRQSSFTAALFNTSDKRHVTTLIISVRTNRALVIPMLPPPGPASNANEPFFVHLNAEHEILIVALSDETKRTGIVIDLFFNSVHIGSSRIGCMVR